MVLSEDAEYVQVGDLKPYLGEVYVRAKIVEMGQVRLVSGGTHRVSETLVGDESGCRYLNLWDDRIDEFEEGDTVHVENGYVSVYRESMRLTPWKIWHSHQDRRRDPEVNTDNNLSDQRVERRQRRFFDSHSRGFSRGYEPCRYSGHRGRRGDWKTGYKRRR